MADVTRTLWNTHRGLVFFAPTGTVVRAIGPCVASKYTDPAVVVCDVRGRWAVSFLSGHEGGANALAMEVANTLGAEPVITTTSEAARDLVVGIGCRRGAAPETIEAALEEALALVGRGLEHVRLLASGDLKAQEPGLREAARRLDLPLRFIPGEDIRQAPQAFTRSEVAERRVSLPGIAEPAALLAGRRTRLLLPRTVLHGLTIAIAQEAHP
jgi:cobalt-precorrin 5A hydrolase